MTEKLFLDSGRTIYVSDDGKIYNEKKRQFKQQVDKNGYASVRICGKRHLVHRLVAMVFISRLKQGEQVHHINENKLDNSVHNLEVMTMKDHQHLHKQIHPITKCCVVCGKEFVPHPTKRKRAKTCSHQCWLQATRNSAEQRKRPIIQYDIKGNEIRSWASARDIQKETGFYESNINKCCNGVIKTYKSFVWAYAKKGA